MACMLTANHSARVPNAIGSQVCAKTHPCHTSQTIWRMTAPLDYTSISSWRMTAPLDESGA
eukprot:4623838-Karenia_brevis.AAC.1